MSTRGLSAGNHIITANYSGDAIYAGTSTTTAVMIAPAPRILQVIRTVKKKHVTQLVVVFNGPSNLDAPNDLNNYQLIAAGRKNSFLTKMGAKSIALKSAVYNPVNHTVTLTTQKPFALSPKVQLQVTGQPALILS